MHLQLLRKAALTLLYGRGLEPHYAPEDAKIRARAAIDNLSGCAVLSTALNLCESLTPTFDSLPLSQQVDCYCYDSNGAFLPSPFDNAASSCYAYAASALPTDAPLISPLLGACTKYASSVPSSSVNSPGSNTLIPVLNSKLATSSAASGVDNLQSCSVGITLVGNCAAATPSFTALPPASQAQCLCYDSSSNYIPSVFDNAAVYCYSYYATATPSLAVDYSALLGFCTSYAASGSVTANAASSSGSLGQSLVGLSGLGALPKATGASSSSSSKSSSSSSSKSSSSTVAASSVASAPASTRTPTNGGSSSSASRSFSILTSLAWLIPTILLFVAGMYLL